MIIKYSTQKIREVGRRCAAAKNSAKGNHSEFASLIGQNSGRFAERLKIVINSTVALETLCKEMMENTEYFLNGMADKIEEADNSIAAEYREH